LPGYLRENEGDDPVNAIPLPQAPNLTTAQSRLRHVTALSKQSKDAPSTACSSAGLISLEWATVTAKGVPQAIFPKTLENPSAPGRSEKFAAAGADPGGMLLRLLAIAASDLLDKTELESNIGGQSSCAPEPQAYVNNA
jgi:hypothetical protein